MNKKLILEDDRMCFVCGPKNDHGLKLNFVLSGDILKTRFKTEKKYQGWTDIIHGGVLALILDEAMGCLLWIKGIPGVTAEFTVRYKEPVDVGDELEFTSRIIEDKGRIKILSAEAKKSDGTIAAKASGKYFVV